MRTPGKGLNRTTWCAAVYAAALLCPGGWARAGSVQVQPIQDCTRQPRITVLRDGKPAAGILVEVYQPVEHPTAAHYQNRVGATLRTDAKGEVVLPKLPPQVMVFVVARWASGSITTPDLEASLGIRYFPEDPESDAHFTMDLRPYPNELQSLEQTARAAEAKPIAERVQQFGGVVVDPAEATIRDVWIRVARLHVTGIRSVREMRTDTNGHFGTLMPAGDYVAIFNGAGFQGTVLAVTIDPAAKQSEMRILLRPGVTE
jgi:hypothetical protein